MNRIIAIVAVGSWLLGLVATGGGCVSSDGDGKGLGSNACGKTVCQGDEVCFDSVCTQADAECVTREGEYAGWPDDSDLEPNGTPAEAKTLPCGEDPQTPGYSARCPSRWEYTNGFMNLVVCPPGERDLYKIYLLDAESVRFNLLARTDLGLHRRLGLRVFRVDGDTGQEETVGTGAVTDDASLSATIVVDGAPGWYFVEIAGETALDANSYTMAFTLNPYVE